MPSDGFDELEDPLERLERNERQASQAFRYVLLSALAMLLTAVAIIAISDYAGSDCPDPDPICLDAPRAELVILPTLLGIILAVTSMFKTYQRWKQHVRWRPWLFATYAMWMLTTACLLLTSSIAFVELG